MCHRGTWPAGTPCPRHLDNCAEVKQQLFDLIEIAYLRAGLLDTGPQQEDGLAAIEALLTSRNGSISAAGEQGNQLRGWFAFARETSCDGMAAWLALLAAACSPAGPRAMHACTSELGPWVYVHPCSWNGQPSPSLLLPHLTLPLPPPYHPEWRGCVPERERQRELLSKGVLRFDGHSVRFASNLAASYAAEQLRDKLAKSVADSHKGLRRQG